VQDDCGAIWRSLDNTKQRCLYCYLCYCLPNWTGEIPV